MENHLSKLLGFSFGLDLRRTDVGESLIAKIGKKLGYWTSIYFFFGARAGLLLSTLYFSTLCSISLQFGGISCYYLEILGFSEAVRDFL